MAEPRPLVIGVNVRQFARHLRQSQRLFGQTPAPVHRADREVDSRTAANCMCMRRFGLICPKHESAAYVAWGAKHKAGQ